MSPQNDTVLSVREQVVRDIGYRSALRDALGWAEDALLESQGDPEKSWRLLLRRIHAAERGEA